ncbi:c-type cytochrome [Catalinimonas niigatensis]|uniref:c-type cytochrome n=1 Tax=Catalinimonas niigatensis TaxID=1397264 RepID=UPI0026662A5E|nr:c-type cytochrome [Catalinimonas niigatensis]WPP51518.1 c-type cytochrome [Catalinimonas niigatensis]
MLKNRLDWHFSKYCSLRTLLTCLALTLSFSVSNAQDEASADGIPTDETTINNGKSLFTNNCTVCHAINAQVVGPALKDVHERRDLPWLQSFIKNSQAVIQSGDDYAVNLYNEYNKTLMPAFDFSDEEVTSIVAYIKSESAAPAESAATSDTAAAEGQAAAGGGATGGMSSGYLTVILAGLLIVLVLILVVLILIISVLTRFLRQKEDLDEEDREILGQKVSVQKVVKSKPFLGISLFLFMAIAVKLVIDGLYSVGIQQGYQPKQPIAFSHALHAGQYQIDCQYCHTGVMKAKSANIPSANICMNCHQQIKPESPEIQKIYAAIDFDPETQTYGNNKKPIEWVRIHNLPDLAYFNHSQHVNVGGLDCETCHGEVQEMEVVYQHSLLTMGWCINCHRETQVNAEGNEYYDKLLELHESSNSNEPMRVEDIGGLECSKCHY